MLYLPYASDLLGVSTFKHLIMLIIIGDTMINTVLGKLEPHRLGTTLCHEHIFVGSTDLSKAFGDRWYDKDALVKLASSQLKYARERFSLNTVIDGTPPDLGRDVDLLVRVSRESGVNIIASTGFYYDDRCYLLCKSPESLAEYFIDECLNGMENTYKSDTPVLPGMLKCATGRAGLTDINKICLRTMAITQVRTSLPLFVHCTHSKKTAIPQLELLLNEGCSPKKTIIGHVSDITDAEYIASILGYGVYVGFDRVYNRPEQVDTLLRLLDMGYEDRIMLSRDGDVHFDFSSEGFSGALNRDENKFTVVLDTFSSMLRQQGVDDVLLHKMLCDNVVQLFEG